MHAAITVITLC